MDGIGIFLPGICFLSVLIVAVIGLAILIVWLVRRNRD